MSVWMVVWLGFAQCIWSGLLITDPSVLSKHSLIPCRNWCGVSLQWVESWIYDMWICHALYYNGIGLL